MSVHLQREIGRLKARLLDLGSEVEETVRDAVKAVLTRDRALARSVAQREEETDILEVDVEEECLKVLALHQPVAVDLRYIVGMLKINQDMERIGDLARHVADRAQALAEQGDVRIPGELGAMADKARRMLMRSLDAFMHLDASLAREVCASDEEVDRLYRLVTADLTVVMRQHPDAVGLHLQVLHIARHLERIADHATNIAEDLIYMVEGRIVRHQHPIPVPAGSPAVAATP
jgi:phosphate transport system protein